MPTRRIVSTLPLLVLLALLALPGIVAAHSELVTSDPADGATLAVAPTLVAGDFSEEIDPGRSTMELRGPDGVSIATGGVPADGPATRMTITGFAALAPGAYEVRWTTVTADDNGVERGTFTFTVAAAASTAAPPSGAATSESPAASPAPASEASAGDLLVPILVVVAVLVVGAVVLLRRRRGPAAG
jgi:copper resistance protein C